MDHAETHDMLLEHDVPIVETVDRPRLLRSPFRRERFAGISTTCAGAFARVLLERP